MIAANCLDIPLDPVIVRAKIQYFLGAFVAYFMFIYICLYLYSLLRYGKNTSSKLYATSYQSEAYMKNSTVTSSTSNSNKASMLSELCTKNKLVQDKLTQEEIKMNIVKQSSKKLTVEDICCDKSYSKGYRKYVQQQRVLLGCSPCLYADGCIVNIPCTDRQILLPPGRIEDMLLFICHNHPLCSCFYFMDGSKLGAHGTRILYIGKDIVVFVLYQFSNTLLQHFMLNGHGLGTFINLFIITPSAVSVGLLLKYLYTCPFTESVEFQRRFAQYEVIVLFLGRLAIAPIMMIMFGSLIVACLLSSDERIVMIVVNYFLYVQLYGILLQLVKATLLFVDNFHYQMSLFGVLDILCIGRLYKERIVAEKLVEDVDYAYRTITYLFGLIKVLKILNREDAIKAKWITDAAVLSEGGATEGCVIEMPGIVESGEDDVETYPISNPLLKGSSHRVSASSFSMDAIYTSNKYMEDVRHTTSDSSSNNISDLAIVTENPIHLLDSKSKGGVTHGDHDYQRKHNQELLHLKQSSINTSSFEDNDAGDLYNTYESNHDDTMYDMADVRMDLEEWRTRRQFKEGTRGSFVNAFKIFEEREQLAQANLERSASMKNTLQLHSSNAKNALAAKKNHK